MTLEHIHPNFKPCDSFGLKFAAKVAVNSPDPSRKIGAAIFAASGHYLSHGCNTFTKGVENTPERLERPPKYRYVEHAERMALYNAARHGVSTIGSTMYVTWYPCADCARGIVQAGIQRLVCGKRPTFNTPDDEKYGFNAARDILREGGVEVVFEVGTTEEWADSMAATGENFDDDYFGKGTPR